MLHMIACESVEATKDKTINEKNDRFRRPCCLRSIRHQASLVILVRSGQIPRGYFLVTGADSGGEEKSKRAEKYGTKKSKERREEPDQFQTVATVLTSD